VRFSVVIATLGRGSSLAAALESLGACEPKPAEVIVVDGAADEAVRELVEQLEPATGIAGRYLTSEPGSTVQRNVGLCAVTGDVVVFADDDIVFGVNVFAALGRAYRDSGVVGATVEVEEPAAHRFGGRDSRLRRWLFGGAAAGTFTRYGYPRYLPPGAPEQDVEVMAGCLMSARVKQALEVGFDETLPGYALAEDEDFSRRLSRLGRIRYLPDARIVHHKRGFGSRDRRAFNRKVARNRTYLFRKNFPQTRLARLQFRLFLLLLLGHRLLNRDWAGARGLLEGVRAAR
jgi:GT2 family glycosyltransferase